MKNLLAIDTVRLAKEYSSADKSEQRRVLKALVNIAFDNNGFLPDSFDIHFRVSSGNSVSNVLSDLGYPHVRDIRCFSQATYVCIR